MNGILRRKQSKDKLTSQAKQSKVKALRKKMPSFYYLAFDVGSKKATYSGFLSLFL